MNDWRIRQQYGFGVGRVCLRVEPYRREAARGLLAGISEALADGRDGLRGLARSGLGVGLALALLIAVVTMVGRDNETSDLEIVPFETAKLEPEQAPPPPEPRAPVVPEPEPPPPEPPPVIAVAEVTPPPPQPPEVRPRPVRPTPPPERPRVQIDAVERAAEPPTMERVRTARAPTRRADRPALRIDALDRQVEQPVRAPRDARVAAVVSRRARPRFEPDPISGQPPAPTTPARRSREPVRRARPARPATGRRAPRPDLAGPAPDAADDAPPLPRAARVAPRPKPRDDGSPRALATPSLPPPASASGEDISSQRRARAPAPPERAAARSGSSADGIAGVPLGSLAACVSDREEDLLKRKLIEVVTTQEECASEAGRYRFVETKNLNAFLMWIERAPSRREADRCVELRLALECLRREATGGAQ